MGKIEALSVKSALKHLTISRESQEICHVDKYVVAIAYNHIILMHIKCDGYES